MAILFSPPYFRATDLANAPIPGAFIGFFATQLSTPQPIYADSDLTIALSNPLQSDGNGVFPAIWLNDALPPYKYVIYQPDENNPSLPGAVLRTGDPYNPPINALALAKQFFPQSVGEQIAGITPLNYQWPPGHLLRYGNNTVPGITDMTATANLATLATVPYSLTTVLNEIVFPAGQVRIDGTVYVRKGQKLRGSDGGTYVICNNAGTGPTFKMGWGLISGIATADSGGQPVMISNLMTIGGPPTGVIDITSVAGAFVYDMFMTSAAIAISGTNSGDINLNNIIFDQGLNGIVITSCSNWQCSMLKFFNINFDISVASNCYDCQFSNIHCEYNQFTSITFADAATNITNIRFTDCVFTYNAQYGTYTGAIQNRANGVIASFNGCSFNNMPGYAYIHGTGVGSILDFDKCIFDGNATRVLAPAYTQSTLAAAILTLNETVRMKNCTFRNLPCSGGTNTPIALSGTLVSVLEIDGGEYSGNSGASLIGVNNSNGASSLKVRNLIGDALQTLVGNQSVVPIAIRNCTDWFGPIGTSGSSNFVLVPYQFSNVYQITLKANINVGGSPSYRKCTTTFAEKDNDFATTAKSFIATAGGVAGAANLNGAISITVEFGAVGGTATIATSNFGSLSISWPNTYTSVLIEIQMIV